MPIKKIEKKSAKFWKLEEDRLRRVLTPAIRLAGNRAAKEAIENVGTVSDSDRRRIFQKIDAISSQRATTAANVITVTSKKQMDIAATKWTNGEIVSNDLEDVLDTIFSANRAKAIGITEITRIAAEATFYVYDQLNFSMIWKTSEDEDVCPICTPKNNESISSLDDIPPAHVMCRCRIGLVNE
jgi:hypothetical protein